MAGSATNLPYDIIEQIPAPETIKGMISETVKRLELLRHLLRVSKRKAIQRQRAADLADDVR